MRFTSLYSILFLAVGCGQRGFNSNPADSRDISKPPAKKDAPDVVLGVAKPSVPASRAQVSIVSIGLTTNKDAAIGKNDRYQICFARDKSSEPDVCLPLDRNEIGGVRADSFDRYQLTPSASGKSIYPENFQYVIFRPDPDSVTAKSQSAPIACLDVRFDGLPKFCKNEFDGTFSKSLNKGSKELRFSMGEREQCVSCEPGGRLTAKPKLGMPGPHAIRVWVRTDATRDVKIVLAESEGGDEVASATARPQPEDDFTATLKVHSEKIFE